MHVACRALAGALRGVEPLRVPWEPPAGWKGGGWRTGRMKEWMDEREDGLEGGLEKMNWSVMHRLKGAFGNIL